MIQWRLGWTDRELAETPKPMVMRLRHILFAEQLTPSATVDVEAMQRAIDDAAFELSDPRPEAVKRRGQKQLAQARLALANTIQQRDALRAVLWPPDEDVDHGSP